MTADQVIDLLGLEPHAEEGGYFRETHRSDEDFEPGGPFSGPRSLGTAIYYLLASDAFSARRVLAEPGPMVPPVPAILLPINGVEGCGRRIWRT